MDPTQLQAVADILSVIVTLGLGLVGFYLAYNIGRQVTVRIAERRLTAYGALWNITCVATPSRLPERDEPNPLLPSGALTESERQQLHKDMTEWYYKDGNGMMLEDRTRTMYRKVKRNLVCPLEEFEPKQMREQLEKDSVLRGRVSMQQISLLRTRMKADLNIYSSTLHLDTYKPGDIEFLQCCGEKIEQMPWKAFVGGHPTSR